MFDQRTFRTFFASVDKKGKLWSDTPDSQEQEEQRIQEDLSQLHVFCDPN